jgi:hypothetical protein
MMGLKPPTKVRMMNGLEYQIARSVFGSTLPHPARILITNAAGLNGRAFTIPSSAFLTVFGINPATLLPSLLGSYIGSAINLAYFMNVGRDYGVLTTSRQHLLIHETTHVWQGKNSSLALSYVFDSVLKQGLHGAMAYSFKPGQPWKSYNAEQQAAIVEAWFVSGRPTTGPLYPYIVNHVQKGDC